MKRYDYLSAVAALLLASSMCAQASLTTNYGNFEGSTVWYNQVSEANTVATGGAYREPTVSADSLNFSPLGMKAAVDSATTGSQLNDYQLAFDVQAKAEKYLAGITFFGGRRLLVGWNWNK